METPEPRKQAPLVPPGSQTPQRRPSRLRRILWTLLLILAAGEAVLWYEGRQPAQEGKNSC